ncbi:MAG: hypothetical protein Q8J78_01910 [Moraxellaceae bacterium]|nr:hypothetical protein [Moraxellaceae bacterium]
MDIQYLKHVPDEPAASLNLLPGYLYSSPTLGNAFERSLDDFKAALQGHGIEAASQMLEAVGIDQMLNDGRPIRFYNAAGESKKTPFA